MGSLQTRIPSGDTSARVVYYRGLNDYLFFLFGGGGVLIMFTV